MPDISRASVHVSTPIGRGRKTTTLTEGLIARRYAGDFSHLPPIVVENDPSPLPDHHKDLPRIPSTSTGLCGSETVTVYTSLSGTLTTSPIGGRPKLPVPSDNASERVQLTEAQKIAAQYRERHRSSSGVFQSITISEPTILGVNSNPLESRYALPSSTKMQSDVRVDGQATDAVIEASLTPQPPPTGRALAEAEITRDAASRSGRAHGDGAVSCTQEDCLEVCPV